MICELNSKIHIGGFSLGRSIKPLEDVCIVRAVNPLKTDDKNWVELH